MRELVELSRCELLVFRECQAIADLALGTRISVGSNSAIHSALFLNIRLASRTTAWRVNSRRLECIAQTYEWQVEIFRSLALTGSSDLCQRCRKSLSRLGRVATDGEFDVTRTR